MPTKGQQLPEEITRTSLRQQNRDSVRQIAQKLHISNIRKFNKEQLIDLILEAQEQLQQPPIASPPQQNEPEDSNVADLTLKSRFNGKIKTYTYSPNENQSLAELLTTLYPKLIFLAGRDQSYKMSIDLRATFQSPKFSEYRWVLLIDQPLNSKGRPVSQAQSNQWF